MPLHPEIAKVLATLPHPPEGPARPGGDAGCRRGAWFLPWPERLPLHAVAGRDRAQTPAVRYRCGSTRRPRPRRTALMVYLHGGAFFLGSLDTHDHVARSLAKETGYKVISVGYRLAPEAAFPAGLEDCYAVVRWAAGNSERLAGTAGRWRIAGDSSGGTFAAAVAAMARDDGFDAHHPPGAVLPLARPRLRRRPLRLAARERHRLRP